MPSRPAESRVSLVLTAICFAILSFPLTASAQDTANASRRPSVEAVFADEAPRIDGHLDDGIWQSIEPIRGFVQRWPEEGAAPTEDTWAKIAYDRDFLYFAFKFSDKNPELIRAKNMERGGRNDRDDHAYIGIDTYLDGRNAYLFEMNALGTQDDAMIVDENMTIDSYSWDAVYRSETVIDDEGWTLEVSIPFRQLRFPEGDDLEFGLFMRRKINRKNETLNWPLIPLTYGTSYDSDLKSVSAYGRLTGLKNIRRGSNIEITPYVITGAQKVRADLAFEETESTGVIDNFDAGFDIKYGITSNLTVDLTVNTDFAQVEADNAQVNLTRFSLFFPEKRPFFLERAGLFDHGDQRRTQTFFSRTIGLDEDILAGARLTGQVGRFSVGFMNLETGDKMGDIFSAESANNLVARIRTELIPRSTVGLIFTNWGRDGMWNRALGADAQYRFWSQSSFDFWFTEVNDWDSMYDDRAGSVAVNLRNAIYGGSYSYTSVGENYRPKLGFVRRRDMKQHTTTATYSPLFENGPFRQITAHVMGIYISGQDNEKQSTSIFGNIGFQLQQRDQFSVNGSQKFERLETPFYIRPDAVIPVGDYTFNRGGASVVTDSGRRFFANAGFELGQFFSGNRTDLNLTLGFRQSKYLTLEAKTHYSKVDLPIDNGQFNAATASLDILASASRKLFAKALIQYDSFSRDITANIRIDWIHTPGSDLFLVFNTSFHAPEDHEDIFDPNRALVMNNTVGVAKLTYLIML